MLLKSTCYLPLSARSVAIPILPGFLTLSSRGPTTLPFHGGNTGSNSVTGRFHRLIVLLF